MAKVAFFTFGLLHEAPGHPRVQGCYDRLPTVYAVAEQSDGFTARSRLDASWGERVHPKFFRAEKHAGAPQTLSLWEDLESVFAFAYSGAHGEALAHRKKWFLTPEWPSYAAWWVEDGHQPDFEEARERHQHLHDHGPSPYCFNFQHPFGASGEPCCLIGHA